MKEPTPESVGDVDECAPSVEKCGNVVVVTYPNGLRYEVYGDIEGTHCIFVGDPGRGCMIEVDSVPTAPRLAFWPVW